MKLEIVIKYPKRTSEEDYKKDWGRIVYEDEFPTKANIATDYKELPIPEDHWMKMFGDLKPRHQGDEIALLDAIFSIMNTQDNPMATKEKQTWIRENKVSHTSMSVGDVIELNEHVFVCASEGWKEVA